MHSDNWNGQPLIGVLLCGLEYRPTPIEFSLIQRPPLTSHQRLATLAGRMSNCGPGTATIGAQEGKVALATPEFP